MFNLSLVLLLVCSAFFCRASPTDLAQNLKNDSSSVLPPHTPPASNVTTNINPDKNGVVQGESNSGKSTEPSTTALVTEKNQTSLSNVTVPPSDPPTTSKPTSKPPSPPPTSSTTSKPPSPPPTSSTTHPTSSVPPTTPPPSPHTSTLPPPTKPTTPEPQPKPSPDGGFNLISFLGGMILGLGLLAIGYVVFKFYQTRRDSSYRTL